MDINVLDAAGHALINLLDPLRLGFLMLGTIFGLALGIMPGIGGVAGTALLLPFTFSMDPFTAFAFLLGLASTTATGDPIPAILFGVPGGAGSAATVLDGLPMTKRGEAGRALSAAYMSSMLGGLFGAALMAATIPLLRPVILYVGSPEMLAFAVLGISLVAVLSGNTPLRGLAAAGFGMMLAMIGMGPQTGEMRWVLGSLYLWDGLPLVPVVLGLFALPELCDLAISRTSLTGEKARGTRADMVKGAKDCFSNLWLIIRCSSIGGGIGIIPGVGGAVIDWLAYGHALRTEKGAQETFGRGDVRGIIASESSNNAKEGGALVPTIAFGVPGSASMAILLGAFLVQGLVPGPDMLTKNLDVTYTMVWSIALANVMGAGLCYLFSGQLAKVATLRYTLILPSVLAIIYVGAFEGSRSYGDLYSLLIFGVLGWTMKQLKWPRPPLLLGFILGETFERYLFVSIDVYGMSWLLRPIVVLLFAAAILNIARPLIQDLRQLRERSWSAIQLGRPSLRGSSVFGVLLVVVVGTMMIQSLPWRPEANTVPLIVGSAIILATVLSILNETFVRDLGAQAFALGASAQKEVKQRMHLDLSSETDGIPRKTVLLRAFAFFGWLIAFIVSMAVIGIIPTAPLFAVAYMRLEGHERWRVVLPQAVLLTLLIYVLFDRLLAIPWPPTLLGEFFPALQVIPSV